MLLKKFFALACAQILVLSSSYSVFAENAIRFHSGNSFLSRGADDSESVDEAVMENPAHEQPDSAMVPDLEEQETTEEAEPQQWRPFGRFSTRLPAAFGSRNFPRLKTRIYVEKPVKPVMARPAPSAESLAAPPAPPVESFGAPTEPPESFAQRVLHLPVIIDHDARKYVMSYLDHFVGLRQAFYRAAPFIGDMAKVLEARGLPGEFVYLSFAESGFTRGGAGPWQFTTATARRFGLRMDNYVDERRDPIKSTQAAAEYLSALNSQVGGDWRLAIVGWNTGEQTVANLMGMRGRKYERMAKLLPSHTRALLNRFIAVTYIAHHVSGLGFTPTGFSGGSHGTGFDHVLVRGGARLEQVAEQAHTSVEMLRGLNPALLQDVIPPYVDSYDLVVPHSELPYASSIPRTDG